MNNTSKLFNRIMYEEMSTENLTREGLDVVLDTVEKGILDKVIELTTTGNITWSSVSDDALSPVYRSYSGMGEIILEGMDSYPYRLNIGGVLLTSRSVSDLYDIVNKLVGDSTIRLKLKSLKYINERLVEMDTNDGKTKNESPLTDEHAGWEDMRGNPISRGRTEFEHKCLLLGRIPDDSEFVYSIWDCYPATFHDLPDKLNPAFGGNKTCMIVANVKTGHSTVLKIVPDEIESVTRIAEFWDHDLAVQYCYDNLAMLYQ